METVGIIAILLIIVIILPLLILVLYYVNPENIFGTDTEEVKYAETTDLETIQATVNANATLLQTLNTKVTKNQNDITSLLSTPTTTGNTTELETRLKKLEDTYIDKTKPISLLSNSCDANNKACPNPSTNNWLGNNYRAIKYDQKTGGLGLHIGHSAYIPTVTGNAKNESKWYINQEL